MVVFAEIPDEITLAINVSNCPHRCPGCHSPELQTDIGSDLIASLPELLEKHKDGVTCVCFMGGEWRPGELVMYCRLAHKHGLKVCLYSGADSAFSIDSELLAHLDYLKLGSYVKDKGPLSDRHTNQRMYKLRDGSGRPAVIDITHKFQKEYL